VCGLVSKFSGAATGLRNVQSELTSIAAIPSNQRGGPNSSLQIRLDGLGTNLENMRKLLNEINDALTGKVVLTP
jgi:hypothetical protein